MKTKESCRKNSKIPTKALWLVMATFLAFAQFAGAQEKLIFSPNGDGVKDNVAFKIALADNAGVSSWLFEIKDGQNRLIQKFEGDGPPPNRLKWDGKDVNNNLVKDGTYFYSLSLVTPAGNRTAIEPSPVIVDRVPPVAEASVTPIIFSPNSQSGNNEAQFHLKGTDDNGIYTWLLTIKDKEGAAARTIGGHGAPPEVMRWDGHGDFEEDVPDGTYTFELTVQDNAGNRTTTTAKTVAIRRGGVASTVQVTPIIFSPNGDGFRDSVVFTITSAESEVVQKWSLRILNHNGRNVFEFNGVKEPPHHIEWDGKLSNKQSAPDGDYTVVLYETDAAGNTSPSAAQSMTIDDTPPTVSASLEPGLLSPGKHGFHDSGVFTMKSEDISPLQAWALKIVNDVGHPVKTVSGPPGSKPPEKLPWNGDGDDGATLEDGLYTYYLEATDIAGNRGTSVKQQMRIDTTPPVLSVMANPPLFSPNAEGADKQTMLSLGIQDASAIHAWSLEIKDSQGKVVRNFTSQPNVIPPKITWDGKNQDRVPLPDGDYECQLSATDAAGNKSMGHPVRLTIGATRPVPTLTVDYNAISPNADGYKDVATFTLKVKAFNPIKEWALRITERGDDRRKSTQALRTFQGRGSVPGQLQWGGENDLKRVLPDGDYSYSLEVIDAANNRAATVPAPIRIDMTQPALSVSTSLDLFSPNGDGFKDDTAFLLTYKDASPIGAWDLKIRDTSHRVVKSFSGTTTLPLSLPWKGVDDTGKVLPDGAYTYVFSAADDVGNKTSTGERIIHIDNTPPEATLQANPTLFSPIGNSAQTETNFYADAKDASNIGNWKLTITAKSIVYKTFSGIGQPPKSFPWEGKSDKGQIVPDGVYAATLWATDEVGNTGKSADVQIHVDTSKPLVTVTAETTPLEELTPQMTVTQLKNRDLVISLASEVLFDSGQAVVKSQAYPTLMKAVALVRRYPQRKVRIEGHADTIPIHTEKYRNNMELSEARALAVMGFFRDKGSIEVARMKAKGYGDTRPRASNATEEGRRQNRRVDIILQREEN
jgi:flagellar motor protein MotB